MTITYKAPCPECGADAMWTDTMRGTGNAESDVDCECQERVVRCSA